MLHILAFYHKFMWREKVNELNEIIDAGVIGAVVGGIAMAFSIIGGAVWRWLKNIAPPNDEPPTIGKIAENGETAFTENTEKLTDIRFVKNHKEMSNVSAYGSK